MALQRRCAAFYRTRGSGSKVITRDRARDSQHDGLIVFANHIVQRERERERERLGNLNGERICCAAERKLDIRGFQLYRGVFPSVDLQV